MAAKVFDGLFLGDSATSMDADFLDLNKISRLINVAGRHLRNSLSGHGFVYKTYYWEDESDFLVFPAMERDKALLDMVEFVDASLRKGLSVLIFSDRGMSRNAFAACAFLMFKYHWGFEKSYDFIISKKRDIQINQGFVQQLFSLEKRLVTSRRKQLRLSDMPPDSDLVVRERLRRDEWDPNYLTNKSTSSAPHTYSRTKVSEGKLRGLRSDELSDDEAEDELLLVNSYLNGMNTITVLPGPYRSEQNRHSHRYRYRYGDTQNSDTDIDIHAHMQIHKDERIQTDRQTDRYTDRPSILPVTVFPCLLNVHLFARFCYCIQFASRVFRPENTFS
jgi:Dual specificity phosphatase, catalytic domain